MFCNQCGNELSEKSKFCPKCGTAVAQRVCSNCGTPYENGTMYCENCGSRIEANTSADDNTEQKFRSQNKPITVTTRKNIPEKPRQTGQLLKTALVSWYKGEVKFAPATNSGKLEVYDNCMKCVNILGKVIFNFSYQEISNVKNSKMMGVFPSMVVTLKTGQKYTFASSVGGSAISEMVDLMQRYL